MSAEADDDAVPHDEVASHNEWLRGEHERMRVALQGAHAVVRNGLGLPPAYDDVRDRMIMTVRARLADLLEMPEERPGCWEAEHVRALEDTLRGIYDELFDEGDR